jgi:osmoprotectant transport system ATP-binding protein
MYELRAVSKRYGSLVAVEDFELAVPPGKTTVLIGPSGCGKSTVLRLMIGLQTPDAGEVRFAGEPLVRDELPSVRRRMGYVIQDGGLFPHLTAKENVGLVARHIGWSRERIDARIAELATLTRFPEGGLDRYPSQLSGGQQQRVSLMRALMLDPEALLLDEPLGALDPMIRFDLQEDLRRVFAELGKTVVLVTHDLAEAAFLGDVILLMRDGRVVQRGSFDEMVRTPADDFVARFVQAQASRLGAGEKA